MNHVVIFFGFADLPFCHTENLKFVWVVDFDQKYSI